VELKPSEDLQNTAEVTTIRPATPPSAGRRGPVPKRRYQQGTLRKENGHYFWFFYRDRGMENGSVKSVFTRFDLGRVEDISELSARREHDRLRNQINRERGSVPPAPRGEKFKDVANAYMKNIAPHLSPSTARQRTSHLRAHLLPRFGESSLVALDSRALQCFSTELLVRLSRKSIINVLGTLLAVLAHAKECGIRVPDVSLGSIKLGVIGKRRKRSTSNLTMLTVSSRKHVNRTKRSSPWLGRAASDRVKYSAFELWISISTAGSSSLGHRPMTGHANRAS
jgi:hypothetical protein